MSERNRFYDFVHSSTVCIFQLECVFKTQNFVSISQNYIQHQFWYVKDYSLNLTEFHRIYGKQVSSQIKSSRSRWSYVIKSVKKSCVTLSAIIFALSGLGSLLGPGLDSTSPHSAKLAATTNCFATGLHIGMTEGGGSGTTHRMPAVAGGGCYQRKKWMLSVKTFRFYA